MHGVIGRTKENIWNVFLARCKEFKCVRGFGYYPKWKETTENYQRERHTYIYISECSFDSKIKDKH